MRILFILLLAVSPAYAQQTETFSTYFKNLPSGSAPSSADSSLVLQGGITKKVSATAFSVATFNASYYGVKCDGATNDAASINNAISSIGSGTLQFPPGTCIVGGTPITLSPGVYLQGSGKGVTIIRATGAITGNGYIIDAFTGGTFSDVGVSDLTVDVNNQTNNGAIRLQGAIGGCYVKRVGIIHMTQFGIVLQVANNCEISENEISKDVAANTQNEGISLTAAAQNSSITVRRNIITNTGTELDGDNLIVDGNIITGFKFGSGVTMGPSSFTHDNIIVNNIASGSSGIDINSTYPAGFELWCPRCVVKGNNSNTNSGNGIMIGGNSMTVVGNVCYDNGQSTHAGDNSGIFAQFVNSGQSANNSAVAGNSCFNFAGTTQAYGYSEASSSLVGIVLGNNSFSGSTAAVSPISFPGTNQMGNIIANIVSSPNFVAAGVTGLSCSVGSVSIGSFTVTDGIVTHC